MAGSEPPSGRERTASAAVLAETTPSTGAALCVLPASCGCVVRAACHRYGLFGKDRGGGAKRSAMRPRTRATLTRDAHLLVRKARAISADGRAAAFPALRLDAGIRLSSACRWRRLLSMMLLGPLRLAPKRRVRLGRRAEAEPPHPGRSRQRRGCLLKVVFPFRHTGWPSAPGVLGCSTVPGVQTRLSSVTAGAPGGTVCIRAPPTLTRGSQTCGPPLCKPASAADSMMTQDQARRESEAGLGKRREIRAAGPAWRCKQ